MFSHEIVIRPLARMQGRYYLVLMTTTNNEKRIAKVARTMAKMVIEMRRTDPAAAARLEAAATATCQEMREGRL